MTTTTLPAIKNYQIVRAIGSGGMSTVYEAIDSKLKRPVAIKVLHAHLYRDPTATERFRREALAAARMDHPNIVRIYDYLYANGTHCIIMEYVQGPDTDSVLKERGPFPVEAAWYIMTEVAKGLAEAHSQDVLHRDVKPSNVLLQRGDRVMLSDFGLARRAVDGRLTQRDAVAGTPCFMSPEQMGNRDVGFATDVYSWAVTFHNLLTGTLPYQHQAFPDVVGDIQNGRVQIDKKLKTTLPPRLLSLLQRCLVKDPDARIADAMQLVGELKASGAPASASLTQYMDSPRASLGPESSGDISVTQIYRAQRMGPMRAVVLVGAIAAAAALLFLGVLWYLDRQGIRSADDVRPDGGADSTVIPGAVPAPVSPADSAAGDRGPSPAAQPAPRETSRDRVRKALVGRASDSNAPVDSGQLFIHCTPWANISIDGVQYGRTPLAKPLTLSRGRHLVRLYNDYCEPLEDEVEIVSNTVTRKRYTLQVKPAYR